MTGSAKQQPIAGQSGNVGDGSRTADWAGPSLWM